MKRGLFSNLVPTHSNSSGSTDLVCWLEVVGWLNFAGWLHGKLVTTGYRLRNDK